MILQCIFPIFFNGLGDFGGGGGLDKNFAANSGVGAGKLLMAGVLRRLELREREIRGKATATATALTRSSQREPSFAKENRQRQKQQL
jgi:hypothetical protein